MSEQFDTFTEAARRVFQFAQEERLRLNHNYLGSEHLLLGIVRERQGIPARVLTKLGVSIGEARGRVEAMIGRGENAVTDRVDLTRTAEHVIKFAVDEARQLGHDHVGTEHLLLGLIRERQGLGAAVLEGFDVSLPLVRHEVYVELARVTKREPTADA